MVKQMFHNTGHTKLISCSMDIYRAINHTDTYCAPLCMYSKQFVVFRLPVIRGEPSLHLGLTAILVLS